ncbi:hypothetical protein CEP54_015988 [Fusarium duplospermum]|uniref:Xaa-Pro dipeptidyl-peptidase C-terminal domain-containing protein n=1 Tax=Fusarium duplospermum TaxID=1325734 RepID=A0A428NJB8_9HYPO|nr:hypothetical protein CEP54_015988 [Fusarium duplospermum]
MAQQRYHKAAERQLRIKDDAYKMTRWKQPGRLITDKSARFPGFRQGKTSFSAGTQAKPGHAPLQSSIVLHESVAMKLSDGTTLYTDIFLPDEFQDLETSSAGRVPALVAWSPYGKQMGVTMLDDLPMRAGVPREWVSGLQKWEGPDPGFWCQHGYAVVNPDSRGAYTSEGDLQYFGHQEAQDGAEFITWVSKQPWCNGKVALTGNSWLAIAQWKIGSLRPEGLAALAPWEGFSDFYRHNICEGGIPFTSFHDTVADTLVSQGRLEDASAVALASNTWNDYWEDKAGHPEWITAPIYVVGSWTNAVHTLGSFKSWAALPESTPKWLRVHNKQEWSDYYGDDARKDLKRFFDFYLHGKTGNGWNLTPTVRLTVLNLGLGSAGDTINRAEKEFPLARTQYVRHYLTGDGDLSLNVPTETTSVSYRSEDGKAVFRYKVPRSCETTGYFMAHLVMFSESPGMDVFVQVERLTAKGQRQGTMVIKPQSLLMQGVIKFLHDRQLAMEKAGLLLHWGPSGQLRAGHAASYDASRSLPAQPFYTHQSKTPLEKGKPVSLDIQLRPYGMYWQQDDILQLTVAGKAILPFPLPGLKMHQTQNAGAHNIQCGGNGEDSSYLLLPIV